MKTLPLLASLLLLPAVVPGQAPPSVDDIRVLDLKAHISFLASDELQGREAGTPCNDIAARYIAREFDRLGLEQVCKGDTASWFQPFDHGKRATRNVLGLVPGTDPVLKDEIVVIGAHYDHVGLGRFGSTGSVTPDDTIHNGADDNASGTAGMMELAEHFSRNPSKRSILFMAFSAEELGLIGSKAYVDEPVLPLDKTVAMINLDMIGRSEADYLFLGGVGTSSVWEGLVDAHIRSAGFELETKAGGEAPSDNTNFFHKGIPVLFFFTNVHDDYHRPTDHVDKINFAGEEKIVRAVARLTRDLADRPERPDFKKVGGMAMPKDFPQRMAKLMGQQARNQRRPPRKVADSAVAGGKDDPTRAESAPTPPRKLGISLSTTLPVTIQSVQAGGAADQCGVKTGDQLIAINGKPVTDYADLGKAAAARKEGEALKLKLKRGDEVLELDVK